MRILKENVILKNLKEEATPGMTIYDYIVNVCDGEIDMDVCDTDIDMMVALCYDVNSKDTEYPEMQRFLDILVNRTKIVKQNNGWSEPILVCDFTSVMKPYNEDWKKFFNMEYSEFDDDEAYYEAVVNLEPLISGNASESTYKEVTDILEGKGYNSGELTESDEIVKVAGVEFRPEEIEKVKEMISNGKDHLIKYRDIYKLEVDENGNIKSTKIYTKPMNSPHDVGITSRGRFIIVDKDYAKELTDGNLTESANTPSLVYTSNGRRVDIDSKGNATVWKDGEIESNLVMPEKLSGKDYKNYLDKYTYRLDKKKKGIKESSKETKKNRKPIKLDDNSERAYIKYVRDWMEDRNFDPDDELSYWSDKSGNYDISDYKKMFDGLYDENGINGELFVSYNEFLNNDYKLEEEFWNESGEKEYKGIKISIEKGDHGNTCYIPLRNNELNFIPEARTQFFNWKDTKDYIDKKLGLKESVNENNLTDLNNLLADWDFIGDVTYPYICNIHVNGNYISADMELWDPDLDDYVSVAIDDFEAPDIVKSINEFDPNGDDVADARSIVSDISSRIDWKKYSKKLVNELNQALKDDGINIVKESKTLDDYNDDEIFNMLVKNKKFQKYVEKESGHKVSSGEISDRAEEMLSGDFEGTCKKFLNLKETVTLDNPGQDNKEEKDDAIWKLIDKYEAGDISEDEVKAELSKIDNGDEDEINADLDIIFNNKQIK